jgi:hypothetical protein
MPYQYEAPAAAMRSASGSAFLFVPERHFGDLFI